MKHSLLKHLVCPRHGGPLALSEATERGAEIERGQLACAAGHVYPIEKYVPRFAATDEYAKTFSAQREYVRRHFRFYAKDRSGQQLFQATTALSKDELIQGLCLEAGCGYGRFVDVVERQGAEVVGVDLSSQSIELAQSFVGMRPKVHLVQADLLRLPFRTGLFRCIYSIGVLHHTPDCRNAFEALLPYLTEGGRISIWVYHPANQANVVRWRRWTKTWSPSALYAWCIVNQSAFSWIRRLPWIRWRFDNLVPGSAPAKGRHFWLRVMEDFDNLSPVYASSHSEDEVLRWFDEARLVDVRQLPRPTSVTGLRPATNAPR